VSVVASRSTHRRTASAIREDRRLAALSRRLRRTPATIQSLGVVLLSRDSSSAGISAGSFWPSPSRVAIQAARAPTTPVQSAAL